MLSEPGEDAPRLVYADWLEERGDPLGELVRLQLEMSRPWATRARLRAMEARECELLGGLGLGRAVGSRELREGYHALPDGLSYAFVDGVPLLCLAGPSPPLPPPEWVARFGWF